MMKPERYQEICDVFAEAIERPAGRRAAFLAERCAGDRELQAEVESLLAADQSIGDFIRSPALEVASEILADERKKARIGQQIGHYKIISLLGAGGMGEVWLAEDPRLKRQVALKLISTVHRPDLLLRFEQEAYAASALNHPNIITIFDTGQGDGWHYIATEYVNGKTLRQLIRDKSLKVAEAVEIASQICAALAAAHAAGIIHRDIKPENIVVRSDGIVKVLDFGLARFSAGGGNGSNGDAKFITKPGMIMGTVTYMSPEQARGLPVDERTDVFSLGIVLYEMLTGTQPFDGVNEIEVLAAILEREPAAPEKKLPAALENVLARALEKNHLERFSAAEMLEELRSVKRALEFSTDFTDRHTSDNLHDEQTVEVGAVTGDNRRQPTGGGARARAFVSANSDRRPSPRRNLVFAALAVLLTALLGVGLFQYLNKNRQPAILTEADKLLVADFENKTGDEELDGLFRQPLAVALAQSPFISLVPDGQIRQTLRQMEKPPGEPLTFEVAKEICQRRGIKAFLKGAIENHGVKYLITLEAFDAQTGERLLSQKAEAADKEAILDSLTEASAEMREGLGESLASIKRFDVPLKTSTTSSLEALKVYTLATKNLSEGKTDEGIVLLKQATEIDPNYAAAYAQLAAAYSNKGQLTAANECISKAFALRARLTEREKQKITGFYYVFVTGEVEKDIENLEVAKQTFPRDSTIPLNLGASYIQLGKFAKAEESARLAISIEPTLFFAYANLGRYLNRQSRFDEARAVFEDSLGRGFDSTQINTGLFTAAFAQGNEAEMRRQLEILDKKDAALAAMLRGNQAIFGGRARDYEKVMTQAVAEANKKEMPDVAADYAVQMAVNLAALGKCREALNWSGRALELDRGQQTLTDATFANALCGGGQAESLIAELKERFPKNTVVNSLWLPIIRASVEMKDSPERAVETLEITRQYEGATYFWANLLRGRAYLRLNKSEPAIGEFRKIIENRGWAVHSPLYALAHLEMARAFRLQNDGDTAQKHSEQFTALWRNADAGLPVLNETLARK